MSKPQGCSFRWWDQSVWIFITSADMLFLPNSNNSKADIFPSGIKFGYPQATIVGLLVHTWEYICMLLLTFKGPENVFSQSASCREWWAPTWKHNFVTKFGNFWLFHMREFLHFFVSLVSSHWFDVGGAQLEINPVRTQQNLNLYLRTAGGFFWCLIQTTQSWYSRWAECESFGAFKVNAE